MENFDIFELLKQLCVAVPSVIASTLLLTEAIKNIFKVEKPWVNQLISWLVAIATAEGFVACGKLSFGLGGWDFAIGAVVGLLAGGASNKLYDWSKVQELLELIISLFGKAVNAVKAVFKK